MKQYQSGVSGEALAEQYLCNLGFTCLERRYRAADGEIDLIMQDQAYVVFVEVKHRPSGKHGDGLLAVTPAKMRRMTHAAMGYLLRKGLTSVPVRFDIVEITADGIFHVPNAFQSSR